MKKIETVFSETAYNCKANNVEWQANTLPNVN